MFFIGLLIALFCLVTFFMPWANRARIKGLDQEIAEMRRQIRSLQTAVNFQEDSPQTENPWISPEPSFRQQPVMNQTIESIQIELSEHAATRPQADEVYREDIITSREDLPTSSGGSFEFNLGTKLPVWIGAVSLICAAFFLVKYSIEAGLLGPLARVWIGTLFGISLVSVGQWIVKRESIANSTRIAQGLVGAGLVTLYFSFYASVSLYHFVPPLFGFAAMTMVTVLAVIMSLRHGQVIAVFGMIGGLLTPALVGSQEPNAMTLFGYLFLLFTGMLYIMARKGWWMLASAALIGLFVWIALWFSTTFSAADSLVLVLFPVAICGSVLSATKSFVLQDRESAASAHSINLLALSGGALTILWLSFRMTLSPFDWSMLGLLTLGCMGLSYFRPAIYMTALLGKLGLDLLLFAIWAYKAAMPDVLIVAAGMAALYVILPYFIMRRVRDPRLWAGLQLVASVALYIICYYRLPFLAGLESKGAWGVISLILAGLSVWQAWMMRLRYRADDVVQEYLVSIYALAATCFISLGLAIELPSSYLAIAISAQSAATMWIYNRSGISALRFITMALTGLFIGLNCGQIILFSGIVLGSLVDTVPSHSFVGLTMLAIPVLHLGLPAFFFGLALMLNKSRNSAHDLLSHGLFLTAMTLVIGMLYCLIRHMFHDEQDYLTVQAGFMERGVISLMMAAIAVSVLQYARRSHAYFIGIWGAALFHLTMLRIGYFDLFLHNPYFDSTQSVGYTPLLNGITMVYGVASALSLYALRDRIVRQDVIDKGYKFVGIAFLLMLVSLNVRQYFHPDILRSSGPMDHTEFYTYSVVWLLTGLGLLTFGIVQRNKAARIASMVFLLLTICKVFLFDASELEGLFRVFSFLGLGLSLIGLSYFYTRFIGHGGAEKDRTA